MLVFDGFPNKDAAQDFIEAVKQHDLHADVYDDQNESDKVDPFPFLLYPPIVLVERRLEKETVIERMVTEFGGEFAGT